MSEEAMPDPTPESASEPQGVSDDYLENATGGASSPTPKPNVFIPFDASVNDIAQYLQVSTKASVVCLDPAFMPSGV